MSTARPSSTSETVSAVGEWELRPEITLVSSLSSVATSLVLIVLFL